MSGLPSFQDFEAIIGQGFTLSYPDYRETLTLVAAEASKYDPPAGLPRGFTLIFEGESRTTMLGQAVYAMDNQALGRVELLLACIGPLPAGGFRYQAIFG